MSLINCKSQRDTCGTLFPSSCVGYQGDFVGVLKVEDFSCNVNLDDIIHKLSLTLKTVQDKLDQAVITLGIHSTVVSDLQVQINTLKEQIKNLDGSTIFVNMDLGCLTSDASLCQDGPKRYSLLSLLTLFKNEICLLKS